MADESAAWTWNDVVARLREAPTGSTLQIAVSAIAEPTSVGLHPMPTGPDACPVSDLVFESAADALVIDPTEEKLREEFKDTRVLHLPMQSVVRVEEVEKRGTLAIRDGTSGEKITPFPMPPGKLGR